MSDNKHIGEKFEDLTIIAESTRKPNGYLRYYWTRCKCGNIKRYRYDQIRKKGNCGDCADFSESLKEVRNGREKE